MSEEKQYPSHLQQGKNLAKFAWEIIKKTMENEESLTVSDEIFEQRLSICKQCEYYDPSQTRCKHCGCWLGQKARWALDSCPIDKWSESADTWVNQNFHELAEEVDKETEIN